MSGRKWGKAGERLEPKTPERAAALRKMRASNERTKASRVVNEQTAHRLWRAGQLCPERITMLLDMHGLYGPEVDAACNAEEPEVDLWEAGKLYPRWDQVLALAALCEVTPRFLCEAPRNRMHWLETSMRFHVPHAEKLAAAEQPPVWSYPPEVVAATVEAS